MAKYKVDDWLRLKGQSDRECVHVIQLREVVCSEAKQTWYEVRLVIFDSYNQQSSRGLLVVNEIEIDRKIEEPESK